MPEQVERLARRFRFQAAACERLGSPLYAYLLARAAEDLEERGFLLELLWPYRHEPGRNALSLRLLAGIHNLVLGGQLPRLARYYPSTGGRLSPEGAWPPFLRACREAAEVLQIRLARPCQTNEVGRCAALLGGFLLIARETGLPLRLLELGASAGLNLRCDLYREAPWLESLMEVAPPLEGALEVAERRGCDLEPLNPTSPEDELTLRSFIWADMVDRLRMLDDAITISRRVPARVDRADAADWLPARLSEQRPHLATVVFHSLVMQYVPDTGLADMGAALQGAAVAATREMPLAWLRLEPGLRSFEVRLSLWPGGDDRLLATATGHGREVRWRL